MSSSPEGFKGKIIIHCRLRAKPGRGDELEAALAGVRDSVYSDDEPDGIAFRVSRYKDEFLLFEEYENVAALQVHHKTQAFKRLGEVASEVRDGEPTVLFYEEIPKKSKL